VSERRSYLAIVNPVAGGGRSRRMLGPALDRLRAGGVEVEVAETRRPGDAERIAREAYVGGQRKFIAVGGDGTSYEVVNGLFPPAGPKDVATLGFLPLGTGNSFLRDFSDRGVEHAIESLIFRRTRSCDVLRLRHRAGVIHYINLLSVGFRVFSGWCGSSGGRSPCVSRKKQNLTGGAACSSLSITVNLPEAR
jgi:diacylglycerol kinase family enzyme